MDWIFEIIKFIIAYGLGMLVTEWLIGKESLEAFDTGYEIGYAKGAEEEQQKHIEWLEKVTDDGR